MYTVTFIEIIFKLVNLLQNSPQPHLNIEITTLWLFRLNNTQGPCINMKSLILYIDIVHPNCVVSIVYLRHNVSWTTNVIVYQ